MGQQEGKTAQIGHSSSPSGRWMALDIGIKNIGVALSDPLKLTARPLTTLFRQHLEQDVQSIEQLLVEHQIQRLIVGRPSHLGGRPSRILEAIAPLFTALKEKEGIPVEWFDERLSTREADELMAELKLPLSERRRRRDEFAAAVILRWYIQERSP